MLFVFSFFIVLTIDFCLEKTVPEAPVHIFSHKSSHNEQHANAALVLLLVSFEKLTTVMQKRSSVNIEMKIF